MAGHSYRDPWVKKAKWLTQALIISCTLNVGLLSTFIYFAVSDTKRPAALAENKAEATFLDPHEKLGMQELLCKYSTYSFQELLLRLTSHDHIESGYTRRDLALASLVSFHHFNLEGALGGTTHQKREITLTVDDEKKTVFIFPGLADYQFQAIIQYAKTEKWPLTAKGIYLQLQASKPPQDLPLLETFYLTPEFHFINTLFSKTGVNIKKEHMALLLTQSSWATISETSHYLRTHGDFTVDERRRFLLQLIEENSKLAGKILLETDQEYCLKQLDNERVLTLCQLLGEKAPPAFLRALLESPRADEIWQKTASILYMQAAEDIPETLNLEEARQRFIHLKAPKVVASKPPPEATQDQLYVVVAGDSLWKIAKKHHTTVDELRKKNNLKSDQLRVGQKLRLR